MLRGKAWKCLGVGAIGAVVGIGSLLAAVVQVLSLFAGTLQDQQINLADIGTLGLSFLSCLAYPKYGITAITLLADALFAASNINNSSTIFSAGGLVD